MLLAQGNGLDAIARFAGGGVSARMRSLVLGHFEQEIQAQIKLKQEENGTEV
jgi:hypothetical protein